MTSEEEWSVNGWLKSFGFEKKYLNRFVDNGYETKKLCSKLKPEDLDEMNITDVVHRSIIFNQSDMLRTGSDRPSTTTQSTSSNPYEKLDKLSSPASPSSDTYSSVFDDISEAKKSKSMPKPISANIKLKSSTVERSSPGAAAKKKHVRRTTSTGMFKLHSLSTGAPKTKLELKLVLRELVQRDGLVFNEPPYCNESGSANISALAELAESFADELNIESLTIMDALEDVWRYKMNENNESVIPKTAKLQNMSNPSSASSMGSFVFNDQGTYSEPFDCKPVNKPSVPLNKPIHHPVPNASVSSVGSPGVLTNGVEGSTYLDPFDAIDGSKPIIVTTNHSIDKKKPHISPKPTAYKSAVETSKDSKKFLSTPESPSLSIHSSSSEEIERSPKVKKSWTPFRRSGKSPDVQKRKINKSKRLSGSMEDLDEKLSSHYHSISQGSRQSLQLTETYKGLSRSISTNPALLYQQSLLVEDFKNSKKKFGGSQGAIHQYNPKITSPIINEFHKAAGQSPTTKSRIKALTLQGQSSSELELSTWIEVYVEGQTNPVRYQKAQTLKDVGGVTEQKKQRKHSGFMSRIFKKKDNSMDKIEENTSDKYYHNEKSGLTASHSLPNIAGAAQVKIHSEYTEVNDLLQPLPKMQTTPPKLPSRVRSHSSNTHNISPSSSPQASPPTHHKLMVKSDSISSNEIIQSLPSSGDDIIEIRVPTPANATYDEPWTHIPMTKNPKTRQSPNAPRNNGRRSSSSSTQSDSPRKGSYTMAASPVRRRKLFDDGNNSPVAFTLPKYYGDMATDVTSRTNRSSTRSLTPDYTLLDDQSYSPPGHINTTHSTSILGSSAVNTKPIFKSTENVSAQETTPPKNMFQQTNDQVSLTPQKSATHKLIHTQSSPGCQYTKSDQKMLVQLKETGISFDGRDIGYTPPVSPEHYDITVQQTTTSSNTNEKMPTVSDFTNLLPGDIVEVSFNKKHRGQNKKKLTKHRNQSLVEAKVELLLHDEDINLTELPYSNLRGEYGIPTALVSRYAQESHSSEEELVKAIDAIRRSELIRDRRSHIPFKKDWRRFNDINSTTLEEFLITIGLPQYSELLAEHNIENVIDLKGSTNKTLNSLPLKESHKKHLCAFVKRL